MSNKQLRTTLISTICHVTNPIQMRIRVIFFLEALCSSMFQTVRAQSRGQTVPFGASNEGNNTETLSMLLVVFVFAFFITGFCSIYIRYCSEQYMVPQTTCGTHGLDSHVLATFPIMSYAAVMKHIKTGQNAALQCAVCLGEFVEHDALRLLPKCSHVFHPCCIDAWLASHVTCPMCRARLNGEVKVEVEGEASAGHVFDESSVRRVEGVVERDESGNVDGCVGKGNGSSKVKAFGVLVRSHSTGHSLVEPGKGFDRFTLRLPEEVMKQILDDNNKLGNVMMRMKRSASFDVVLQGEERGEGSSTSKGKNNDRWVLSMTPPFVSRGWGSMNVSTTCSGIPRFWGVREEKESHGRTIFEVL